MARDLSKLTTFPFTLPVAVRSLDDPAQVEPDRAGERGVDCPLCAAPDTDYLWSDDRWRLWLYTPSPFRGVVILSPREHVQTVGELSADLAADLGPMLGRVDRAVYGLGGIGRVHLNYWGDGSAHLHIWFYPRPYGALQLRGTFLGMWSVLLPDLPDEQVRSAGVQIARTLAAESGTAQL
ncbi:MAG TPA: hypothetical protein VFX70_12235 [Mycobacteriales bacterium]|nr:hypothetical protein [Mycobacteriales bacterium]